MSSRWMSEHNGKYGYSWKPFLWEDEQHLNYMERTAKHISISHKTQINVFPTQISFTKH